MTTDPTAELAEVERFLGSTPAPMRGTSAEGITLWPGLRPDLAAQVDRAIKSLTDETERGS